MNTTNSADKHLAELQRNGKKAINSLRTKLNFTGHESAMTLLESVILTAAIYGSSLFETDYS